MKFNLLCDDFLLRKSGFRTSPVMIANVTLYDGNRNTIQSQSSHYMIAIVTKVVLKQS